MASKRRAKLERASVPEDVNQNVEKMDEHDGNMEIISNDVEVVADTLSKIEGGTVEGQDTEQHLISEARDIGVEHFHDEKDKAELVHNEAKESENEMTEASDISKKDIDKINEADSKLKDDFANDRLAEAQTEAQADIDLLTEYTELSENEREISEKLLEEYLKKIENAQEGS